MSTVATGLKSYAEVDVLSVTDAALNTAGVVGMRFDASVVIKEHVVCSNLSSSNP